MGSLDKRLERLEAPNHYREALLAELGRMEEARGPLLERAEREAAEGDPRRLHALEELEEFVRQRRRERAS